MPKRQIFKSQQTPGLAARNQGAKKNQYDIRHDQFSFARVLRKSTIPMDYEVFATHTGRLAGTRQLA